MLKSGVQSPSAAIEQLEGQQPSLVAQTFCGLPGTQAPPLQNSPLVQASPSLQGAPSGSGITVQKLPAQIPFWQGPSKCEQPPIIETQVPLEHQPMPEHKPAALHSEPSGTTCLRHLRAAESHTLYVQLSLYCVQGDSVPTHVPNEQ